MATALVTGASGGIGATYADRLAARGYDLVLVARSADKLAKLADRLKSQYGIAVEVIVADLTDAAQLETVQQRLSQGGPVDLLVNNAGSNLAGNFAQTTAAQQDWLIRLNVTAPTLLAHAALPGMVKRGQGAIINIASVLALAPEFIPGIYSATKSYMLTFSKALQVEFADQGIYVQAVLPAATRTDIWEKSGMDVNQASGVMDVGDLVDAALVGFDRKEPVTIPPLPDEGQWVALEQARFAMMPGYGNDQPAARYRS